MMVSHASNPSSKLGASNTSNSSMHIASLVKTLPTTE